MIHVESWPRSTYYVEDAIDMGASVEHTGIDGRNETESVVGRSINLGGCVGCKDIFLAVGREAFAMIPVSPEENIYSLPWEISSVGGLDTERDKCLEIVDFAIQLVCEVCLYEIVDEWFAKTIEVVFESSSPECPSPILQECNPEDVVVEIHIDCFAVVLSELEVVGAVFIIEIEERGFGNEC